MAHAYTASRLTRPSLKSLQLAAATAGRAKGVYFALRRGELLVDAAGAPQRVPSSALDAACASLREEVFLGVDASDGVAHFAADVGELADGELDGEFRALRTAAHKASALSAAAGRSVHGDLAAAGLARNLLKWLQQQRFCANCGAARAAPPLNGGAWSFTCSACGSETFPRVDPVVITACASADGTRCLLGRQATWPIGMHSCLAGFLDPGETLEEGVAREVLEESGVTVRPGSVRYHSSQPWPNGPSTQVMLGTLSVAAEGEGETISVDTNELEAAAWFERDELEHAVRVASETMRDRDRDTGKEGVEVQSARGGGGGGGGKDEPVWIPPPVAMAHHLIAAWLDEPKAR